MKTGNNYYTEKQGKGFQATLHAHAPAEDFPGRERRCLKARWLFYFFSTSLLRFFSVWATNPQVSRLQETVVFRKFELNRGQDA
ncbi:MAG: hypothetical protein FJZ79_03970 [Chlorobi bacterium]|nr:hypothetical protein [Chlorobiota bacterium]